MYVGEYREAGREMDGKYRCLILSLYSFSCECNLAMYSGALTKGETVVEGTEGTRDGTKDGQLQHETLGACCWEWIEEKRHMP